MPRALHARPPAPAPAAVHIATERMTIRDLGDTRTLARAASVALLLTAVFPVPLLVATAGLALFGWSGESLGLLWGLVALTAGVLTLATFAAWLIAVSGQFRGPAELRADARTVRLSVARDEDLAAHEVVHLWVRGDRCLVFLRDGRQLLIPLQDIADVEGLLEQLASGDPGVAASFPMHRAGFGLHDMVMALYLVFGGVLALAFAMGPGRWYEGFAVAVFLLASTLSIPAMSRLLAGDASTGALVIGADGVRIETNGSARFLSYADIAAVRPRARGLTFELRGGEALDVHLVPARFFRRHGDPARDALARKRVAAAYQLLARRLDEYAAERVLPAHAPPEAETVEAFREAITTTLRALGGNYRSGGLTPVDAATIAADPRAPRPQRIGAALAVSDSSDPEARARVRIAAELCADEALRAALEEAAEGELTEPTRARFDAAAVAPPGGAPTRG